MTGGLGLDLDECVREGELRAPGGAGAGRDGVRDDGFHSGMAERTNGADWDADAVRDATGAGRKRRRGGGVGGCDRPGVADGQKAGLVRELEKV